LSGRRVLWFDPNPAHNNRGLELLRAAAADCDDGGDAFSEHLVEALTLDEAWSRLSGQATFDLVVSHWGHGLYRDGRANGEELLRRLSQRRADGAPAAPVIVFAGGRFEAENRRRALGLGAVEFVSRWEDLIAVLERVLGATFSGP
jgi:CheY-like chemotaxis protein